MNNPPIKSFKLDENYFHVHKKGLSDSGFGMDNTPKLVEKGFGLYSCAETKDEIGPLKTNFYRVSLCLKGSLKVVIGLETFYHKANTIHFSTPGRLFTMTDKSPDIEAYYLFFTLDFIEEIIPETKLENNYPFFNYLNTPFFELSKQESDAIQALMLAISNEIKTSLPDSNTSIKLLLNLILIAAKRSYLRQGLVADNNDKRDTDLVDRYKKIVAQHFITIRTVKEYAEKLAVSPNHLNKVVKLQTGKSAGVFIDEMLVMQIKALLRYSQLNISEIAYELRFTDTSHLGKFFKKYTEKTPLEYRKQYQ